MNKYIDEIKQVLAANNAPKELAYLFFEILEDAEQDLFNKRVVVVIDFEQYYDFLESCQIGHNKIKSYVNKSNLDCTAKLTKKGIKLLHEVVNNTAYGKYFTDATRGVND